MLNTDELRKLQELLKSEDFEKNMDEVQRLLLWRQIQERTKAGEEDWQIAPDLGMSLWQYSEMCEKLEEEFGPAQ